MRYEVTVIKQSRSLKKKSQIQINKDMKLQFMRYITTIRSNQCQY